jgi:hypothetical protein
MPPPAAANRWAQMEVPVLLEPDDNLQFDGAPGYHPAIANMHDPGWKSVQTGLQFMAVAMIIYSFGLVGYLLGAIFAAALHSPELIVAVVVLAWGAGFVGFVLHAVGLFMCCATPKETGLYGMILAAAICWVTIIGSIATPFIFLLYLRSLGQYLGNQSLASNALSFLITVAAAMPLLLVFMVCMSAVGGPGLGLLMTLILFIAILIMYSVFYRLLISARMTITRARLGA